MLEPAFGEAVVDAVVGAPACDVDELVEQPAATTIAATRRWRGHRRARLFCVRLRIGTGGPILRAVRPASGTSYDPVVTPAPSPAGRQADGPTPPQRRRPMAASLASLATVVGTAAALAGGFDALLAARARAGPDNAQRLSVILTYLGVDRFYVLARAFGLAALVMAAGCVAFGLEAGARRVGGRPAPRWMVTAHRQAGLAVVVLAGAHALVPLASPVPPYGGWVTVLVPLAQPSWWGTTATLTESLGILALYLFVLLGPTYYLLAGRTRVWSRLHWLTVAVYGAAVAHAFFLGSDFYVAGPARVVLVAAQVPVVVVLARRLAVAARASSRPMGARVGAVAAWSAAVALAGLAAWGMAGAPLGGFRLS